MTLFQDLRKKRVEANLNHQRKKDHHPRKRTQMEKEAMKVRKRGVESLVDRTMVRQRGEASQMNDIFEQIT